MISENEIVIQIDFAENYSTVFQDEIQSAHWSHGHVTIFTCCTWTFNEHVDGKGAVDGIVEGKCGKKLKVGGRL